MLPGPQLYYKCPKCKNIVTKGSLLSGNTFGAKLYSDGKQMAPMLPEYPTIVKCQNCESFFWLKDENEIKSKKENADKAKFLTSEEYLEAIDSKYYKNEDELKFFRIRLWWSYNDNARENEDIHLSEIDQNIYENNCVELIKILDQEEINEKIMVAELYKNLGDFDDCKKTLETFDEKFNWIKELMNNKCNINDKGIFILKQ
jgi:hypothetical protein